MTEAADRFGAKCRIVVDLHLETRIQFEDVSVIAEEFIGENGARKWIQDGGLAEWVEDNVWGDHVTWTARLQTLAPAVWTEIEIFDATDLVGGN